MQAEIFAVEIETLASSTKMGAERSARDIMQ
jgi:hypothetical protein